MLESMAIMGILTPPYPPPVEMIEDEVVEAATPFVMQVTETEAGGGGDGAAGGCEGTESADDV